MENTIRPVATPRLGGNGPESGHQGRGPTYHSATAFFSEEPTVTLTP